MFDIQASIYLTFQTEDRAGTVQDNGVSVSFESGRGGRRAERVDMRASLVLDRCCNAVHLKIYQFEGD